MMSMTRGLSETGTTGCLCPTTGHRPQNHSDCIHPTQTIRTVKLINQPSISIGLHLLKRLLAQVAVHDTVGALKGVGNQG